MLDQSVVTPPTQPPQTFRPLPYNLGSQFSVYNLMLTQVDEIWRRKNWGAIKKNFKKIRPLPDNLGSWFSEYNLILTQLDEICKNNNNWGAIKK